MKRLIILFFACVAGLANAAEDVSIVKEYPHLQKYLYSEQDSTFRFGFGLTPIRIMKSKAGMALNIFQIHWRKGRFDWEIFNASFGTTISSEPTSKVQAFTFRTSPKFRASEGFSIGPLVGLEFVSFPDVRARIGKNTKFTPEEPYSSRGLILGGMMSETFTINNKYQLLLNQVVYNQFYSTKGTNGDWEYLYSDRALRDDPKPISPGIVIALEFCLLF